jgi:taurine--2-oxoglutarate transaminase
MTTATHTFPARPTTDADIRALDHAHVFHSWSAQDEISPLPVASGSGASFTDFEGNGYLDFGSQLVYVNLGHSHPRLVQAIKDQADTLPTIAPGFANDARAQLAAMIASVAPATSTTSSSPTVGRTPTRTRSGWPARSPDAARS